MLQAFAKVITVLQNESSEEIPKEVESGHLGLNTNNSGLYFTFNL